MYFRLSTHHRSNTNVTDDQDLILAVVKILLQRGKLVLIVPEPMTQDEYEQADGHESFDPAYIADWISIIPEEQAHGV